MPVGILSGDIIKLAIAVGGLAVTAGGAYIGWRYRQRMRERVISWLNSNNLTKAALTEVRVVYDRYSVGSRQFLRCIFVSTTEVKKQKISEEILTDEDLKRSDPDVYNQLQNISRVEQEILAQIQ